MRAICIVAVVVLVLLCAAAISGGRGWLWALASNFLPQIFLAGLAVGVGLALTGQGIAASVALGVALVAGGSLLRDVRETGFPVSRTGPSDLRVITVNALAGNDNLEGLLAVIARHRPDVLILQEIDEAWSLRLSRIRAEFRDMVPLGAIEKGRDRHGTALFSTRSLGGARVLSLGGEPARASTARIEVDGRQVSLLAFHGLKPTVRSDFGVQTAQLRDLSDWIGRQDGAVVVAGDFNATLHMPAMRELVRAQRLEGDVAAGTATTVLLGTYPAVLPIGGLKIDHIFARGARMLRAQHLSVPGSDHRAILAEIALDG